MRPDLWTRVTDLMDRALAVPLAERLIWLEAEAGGDQALIAEVTRLLDAHASAGAFLQQPLLAEPGAAAAVQDALRPGATSALGAGATLGSYRIIREIGRGGMGTVYLGARADDVFDKQVAIKVVPGAMVSDALHERFARERKLLAALDHPGIARVLDGGTTVEGLQYLVMEYVDGTPIDTYCETHALGVAARLRLVLDVCHAVQYAHGRLIVHRDIKASNVLVSEEGHPKLLDFGIAKLLGRDPSRGDPGGTAVQAWTPESASPEQVRGEPTTIATDVYGLGALVYRLLTGRPVFDLEGLGPVDRARVICETPPVAPSRAAQAPGARGMVIPEDVDLIVLKALHKDPSRRFSSAERLAEDIERHLAHRPVLAAPDRWSYRGRKFVARHPWSTAATVLALVAIVGATTAALWQARRADLERDRARAQAGEIRRLANTLIFDVYDRVENSPNATTIRRSLVQQGMGYLDRVAQDVGSDLTLSLELADAYGRLAAVQGVPGASNLGDRQGATESLNKGRALLAPLLARADVPIDVELADLRLARQLISTVRDDPPHARELASAGVDRARALASKYPGHAGVIEALASAYFFAALVAGRDDQLPLWMESNRGYRELVDHEQDNASHLRSLALTEKYIGATHHGEKRLDPALASYERALDLDRRVKALRPDDRQTTIDLAFDLGNVASVVWERQPPDLPRARALYVESLALRERAASQDPQDVYARQALGYCLIQLSDLSLQLHDADAALAYGRRAVEAYESLPPAEQLVRRGMAWLALAKASQVARRQTEACDAFRRASAQLTKASTATQIGQPALDPAARASLAEGLKRCGREG